MDKAIPRLSVLDRLFNPESGWASFMVLVIWRIGKDRVFLARTIEDNSDDILLTEIDVSFPMKEGLQIWFEDSEADAGVGNFWDETNS